MNEDKEYLDIPRGLINRKTVLSENLHDNLSELSRRKMLELDLFDGMMFDFFNPDAFLEPSSNELDIYKAYHDIFEKHLLEWAIMRYKSNQTHIAKHLGLNRGTLRKKLKKHGWLS